MPVDPSILFNNQPQQAGLQMGDAVSLLLKKRSMDQEAAQFREQAAALERHRAEQMELQKSGQEISIAAQTMKDFNYAFNPQTASALNTLNRHYGLPEVDIDAPPEAGDPLMKEIKPLVESAIKRVGGYVPGQDKSFEADVGRLGLLYSQVVQRHPSVLRDPTLVQAEELLAVARERQGEAASGEIAQANVQENARFARDLGREGIASPEAMRTAVARVKDSPAFLSNQAAQGAAESLVGLLDANAPPEALAAAFQDFNDAVQQGVSTNLQGTLTTSTTTDLQGALSETKLARKRFNVVLDSFDPRALTIPGKALTAAGNVFEDITTTPFNEADRKRRSSISRFAAAVNLDFSLFVKKITGAQFSEAEAERYKGAYPNIEDTTTEFIAKAVTVDAMYREEEAELQRLLDHGFSADSPQASAALTAIRRQYGEQLVLIDEGRISHHEQLGLIRDAKERQQDAAAKIEAQRKMDENQKRIDELRAKLRAGE